jgi:hypothetical protein
MNLNKIQEILEFEDWDKPLTDEALEELGFVQSKDFPKLWEYDNGVDYPLTCVNYEVRLEMDNGSKTRYWTTVGSVKMLIEALKGDE